LGYTSGSTIAAAGVVSFCGKVASGFLRWKTTSLSLGASTLSMQVAAYLAPDLAAATEFVLSGAVGKAAGLDSFAECSA